MEKQRRKIKHKEKGIVLRKNEYKETIGWKCRKTISRTVTIYLRGGCAEMFVLVVDNISNVQVSLC